MPSCGATYGIREVHVACEVCGSLLDVVGTNLRHGTIDVPDELGRRLIGLLDGTRDRAALLRELGRPADELERSLEGLARIAVLER